MTYGYPSLKGMSMATQPNTPIDCPVCKGSTFKPADKAGSFVCTHCGHLLKAGAIREITRVQAENLFAGFLGGAVRH